MKQRSGKRRRIGVVILVAFLLLWGVDLLLRMGTEVVVARQAQEMLGLKDRPEVDIRGLFFVPQLVRGVYGEVDATTRAVTGGPLQVDQVDSEFRDVRVPFRDVVARDLHRVAIGESRQLLSLGYDDLNAYLERTERPVRLAPAPNGEVAITGTFDLSGQQVEARASVSLSVENSEVKVTPREIKTGSDTLDQATRVVLGERLSLAVPVGELPHGHVVTAATPYPEGVRLEARSEGLVLER